MTGAIAGQGMMGYSDTEQVAGGLRQRCWARAYVIVDAATGEAHGSSSSTPTSRASSSPTTWG